MVGQWGECLPGLDEPIDIESSLVGLVYKFAAALGFEGFRWVEFA